MKKKVFVTLLVFVMVVSSVFAASNWYDGLKLKNYDVTGIKNVDKTLVYDVVSKYIDDSFSKDLYAKIESELNAIEGIEYVSASVIDNVTPSGVKLLIDVKEYPQIKSISYVGNEKVKAYDLTNSLNTIQVGKFFNPSKKVNIDLAINELNEVYKSKGFKDTPITLDYTVDQEKNKIDFVFTITEGEQTRVATINYEGNVNASASALKKVVLSKTKSLFNSGYLDNEKLNTDANSILAYYSTIGYVDAKIKDIKIVDNPERSNDKYKAVDVTFVIDEGKCWYYGGINVSGNTIYTDEEINSYLTLKQGSKLNYQALQGELEAVTDIYYNNGYISNMMNITEDRDEVNNTITYNIAIVEGPQAFIEDIKIVGLTKTKEYVMSRELEFKPGDVFSKAKLMTSAQNLYNTGLLSDLNYDILYGTKNDSVIIEYDVEEGNQMDIQFGATFGGTITGFPISGFLQWADHNLGGRGQELDISTNLNPDSQTLSLTFGDNWVKSHRWANSISLSFSHTQNKDKLQKATDSDFNTGRNDLETHPEGVTQEEWNNKQQPEAQYLMNYDLLAASLTYQTGYTFIYDFGRLSLSGGLSFSLNKALFDDNFVPFDRLIFKYGENWQFSNRLMASITWDGRDYITAPTKGYVLSTSLTYAGGILGGLSNYIKVDTSASAYVRLMSFDKEEMSKKNLMLCFSTEASVMLNQYFNNGWGLEATEYEMLYIDGMTKARGHKAEIDNVFLWDNMVELSYPIAENVLQAEAFVSGTSLLKRFEDFNTTGLNWYFSAGAGVRLKISGFPLGFYLVKNATYNKGTGFNFLGGNIFANPDKQNSGMSFVLAISTSLI